MIGDEFTEEDIKSYDRKVHVEDFPPIDPLEVRELVGDGNSKVLTKVCAD